MLSAAQIEHYQAQGYLVVEGLFDRAEIEFFRQHYEAMRLHDAAQNSQALNTSRFSADDPLRTYPRLMHPHRRDEASLRWMIDPRLNACMTGLLGVEPYAVQTMFYFKPPGARGQALHQDQYYLRVQPGTCMAAWLAVDDCDEENGCLRVAAGSHAWPLLCTVEADVSASFTDVTVPLPAGVEAVPVIMQAGDVLFFNGQIVHGSLPNSSTDRFRRALIGHYVVGDAHAVNRSYHPVLRMDGSPIEFGASESGGECGVWVEDADHAEVAMQAERVPSRVAAPSPH